MAALEEQLKQAHIDQCQVKMIVTDGVFSMDGTVANLEKICELATEYQALVMIDDCHATGFIGKNGKGSAELTNTLNKVDIISSTLGKALGGASGGFIAARKPIIDLLRQKSRPYLFSNSIAPMIAQASLTAFDIVANEPERRDKLTNNTLYFRNSMIELGFEILPGQHPIVPVMFYDAEKSARASQILIENGILAVQFSYPVVPKNKARVRLQVSANHTKEMLNKTLDAFHKLKDISR